MPDGWVIDADGNRAAIAQRRRVVTSEAGIYRCLIGHCACCVQRPSPRRRPGPKLRSAMTKARRWVPACARTTQQSDRQRTGRDCAATACRPRGSGDPGASDRSTRVLRTHAAAPSHSLPRTRSGVGPKLCTATPAHDAGFPPARERQSKVMSALHAALANRRRVVPAEAGIYRCLIGCCACCVQRPSPRRRPGPKLRGAMTKARRWVPACAGTTEQGDVGVPRSACESPTCRPRGSGDPSVTDQPLCVLRADAVAPAKAGAQVAQRDAHPRRWVPACARTTGQSDCAQRGGQRCCVESSLRKRAPKGLDGPARAVAR